jgi:BREX system ATP-binding protein BrxC/D
MDVFDVQALPIEHWLRLIEHEYFSDYLPAGGAAAKFVIADETTINRLPQAIDALARRHETLVVQLSAASTRLHMLQDVFFAMARSLPWNELLQRYIEALFTRNGYTWPRPGADLTMPELAQHFGVAPNLLAHSRDQWLTRDLWDDASLAQDFRAALLGMCLDRLSPEGTSEGPDSPVMQWLRGEKVGLALLRRYDIAARITRNSARGMLISLCHFLRKVGCHGLILVLDLRPALRAASADETRVRYSPAALMDLYEVLREIIDDIEHLPGLFVLTVTDQTLLVGDRRRTLDTYKALEMRIWPDVRPGDRQNPLAPLVTVSA